MVVVSNISPIRHLLRNLVQPRPDLGLFRSAVAPQVKLEITWYDRHLVKVIHLVSYSFLELITAVHHISY